MGQPAARMGDPTAHGLPLGPAPGCVTVLIAGQPAWRVGIDVNTCVPYAGHVAGVVTFGSTSVIIGGAPAARAGDSITEAGSVNTILPAQFSVLIG